MKKIISAIMSVLMVVTTFSFATPAFATENTKSTAYTLTLDEQYSVTYEYAEYDFTMWFVFTAPSDDIYQFEALNPYVDSEGTGSTWISLYDSTGYEIDFGYVDDSTGRCIACGNLSANTSYYLEVDCASYKTGADYTLQFLASRHTHDYVLKYSDTYSDYIEETYVCSGCGDIMTTQTDTTAAASTDTASSSSSTTVKKTSIKKLTKKNKGFKVTWKKVSAATGYQVQYATNKKFTKNKKTVTIKKASTTSKTIKGLKSKKTYYVRVRTYKTVNGKKVYSNWSTVKKVTTK